MSSPDPADIPPAPDPIPSAPPVEPAAILLRVPTTEHLSQARLEEIATQCLVEWTKSSDGDGIEIHVRDDEDAKFWARRAAFWAQQAEAIA